MVSIPSFAQEEEPVYDEISVYFSVPRIGGADIPALLSDETLYLSVIDVFNFLKIKNSYSQGFDSVNGFFINQQAEYLIDRVNNRIIYLQKEYDLKPGDLIRTETNLYLKSSYFGSIFGLECAFNFRSLSVTLNTKIELPVIREMRQEQMRSNLGQITGEIKADTIIKRKYPVLHFGMADWSVMSSQIVNGKSDTRLSLNLGSVIAGGEANVTLNYNNNSPFKESDQYYLWRYANNDHRALRQFSLGKISADATSSLTSSVIGFQITNTPTTYRGSFGTYTLSDVTEPGWLVELYVNNVLVDYKKADASGLFTFDVPLVYGNTEVKLQFYGPWGEERSKEQSINIPFNFLPVGNLEYVASAGIVQDTLSSRYSRANIDYGLTRWMTVGGGVEYLSSVTSGNLMPFMTTSIRLFSNLLLSGEYTHGVRYKGNLSFRTKSNMQLELNYTKYDKGQKSINTNYLEERRFAFSAPIRFSDFSLFSRLSINQAIMPLSENVNAELTLSGGFSGINANLTTSGLLSDLSDPSVYSNLSLSIRLPGSIIVTPQTQFDYNPAKFVSAKCGIEKHLFKNGYLNLSYEKNFKSNYTSIEAGFRYDFSFAQLSVSARRSSKTTTIVESANGSLMADARTRFFKANSRASVGKGGMTLYTFLDLNNNGKHDKEEPKVAGLKIHINGGRTELNEKDTTIRVYDLEPYTNYLVSLNGTSFDNIAWQLRNKALSVTADPNQFKLIEIPVAVMGEASGMLYFESKGVTKGQGRVRINIYRKDHSLAGSTLSEPDGYFSYLGLVSGNYTIAVDTAQMRILNMTASPSEHEFSISNGTDGDVVDGFEFVVRSNKVETIVKTPTITPVDTLATQNVVNQPKTVAPADSSDDAMLYKVQFLAIRRPININDYFAYLLNSVPGLSIFETLENDGLYHYSTGAFKTKSQAYTYLQIIKKAGWSDCFVSEYKGKKRAEMAFTLKAKDKSSYVQGEILYNVQLMALRKPLVIKDFFGKLLSCVPGLTIIEKKGEDGLYHYNTADFRSKTEAKEFLRMIKKCGWTDCFIVASTYKAKEK